MSAQAIGSENGIQKGNVQITFPSVYESVYKGVGKGMSYYPTAGGMDPNLPEGKDIQAQWHEQKKKDADYMASQKVVSTRNMNSRAFSSHAGYYGMPKPSLVQRKFANPSLGATESASARQSDADAPFHWSDAGSMAGMELEGGVLRSKQGQEYGKKVLLSRITQLNAIDEAKKNFVSGLPAPALGTNDRSATTSRPSEGDAASGDVRESLKVELNNLIKSVDDALEGGPDGLKLNRLNFADATRMLSVIFRIAPRVDVEELTDLYGDIATTLETLVAVVDPDNDAISEESKAIAISLADLYERVGDYLKQMIAGANLSAKDRLDLSKNLVKSLGFSKLGILSERPRAANLAQAQEDLFADVEEDDDDEGFDAPAPDREDEEHGTVTTGTSSSDSSGPHDNPRRRLPVRNPRANLTVDERQLFGYHSGQYYPSGGRPAAQYFGEEASEGNVSGPGFSAVAGDPSLMARVNAARLPGLPTFTPIGSVASTTDSERMRRAEGAAPRRAAASSALGLRRVFDRDTQGFNVDTGRSSRSSRVTGDSPPPSTTTTDRIQHISAMATEYPLPRTAEQLREQTRTMNDVRMLVRRMNSAGIAHSVRPSTSSPDLARKNIAKKLGIKGRF